MCDDVVGAVQKQQSENDLCAIVPFGKYKGQPVTVLSGDPAYCEWLQGQDGIRKKYPSIVNLIVNNFSVPQDTPEHNALQAVFVDNEEFMKKLATVLCDLNNIKPPQGWVGKCYQNYCFEEEDGFCYGCSKKYDYDDEYSYSCRLGKKCWCSIKNSGGVLIQQMIDIKNNYLNVSCNIDFEVHGWDVVFSVCPPTLEKIELINEEAWKFCKNANNRGLKIELCYGEENEPQDFLLEVKPQIGDDYPAVMREIKARQKQRLIRYFGGGYSEGYYLKGRTVLLYQRFTGKGITEAQMRKILGTCAEVFRFDEIDKIKPVDFNFTFSYK